MKVIADRKWERIEIITNSHNEQSLNPVFTALQAKVAAGVLPENTRFYAVSLSFIHYILRAGREWTNHRCFGQEIE